MSYLLAKKNLLKKIKTKSKKQATLIIGGLSFLSLMNSSPTSFAAPGNYYGYGNNNNTGDIYDITGTIDSSSYYNAYGGYTLSGNAYNNTLIINGGTINYAYGGYSISGSAYNNTTTLNGGTVSNNIYGGYTKTDDVYNNTLNINGGTVTYYAIAGYSESTGGNTFNNTANITGGTIGNVEGGVTYGSDATAYDNTVNVYGGTITSLVVGGKSGYGDAYNNTVNIYGGTISGNVYGGYSNTGNVYGNTVTIDNTQGYTLDLSNAILYGGYSSSGSVYDNTLNVYGKGYSLKGINAFDTINFYMPSSTTDGSTILSVSGTANISGATINPYISGNSTLSTGDIITLISATTLTSNSATYNQIMEGVSLIYPTTYTPTSTSLTATITGSPTMSSQTKSLVETTAASAAFINSGINMTSDKGISNAVDASAGMSGFAPFAAFGNSSMRYNTGSHVDSTGNNLNIGVAKTIDNKKGQLTFGPLVEVGWGSYDSYLDSGIHAKGNTNYTGVGAFARQTNKNGKYYEASLHYGHMDTDYNSTDLTGSVSNEHYKMNTPYYGMHLGAGKIINLDKKHDLDLYGKYYYSHQEGDDVNLTSGETYDFSAVDSSRLRAGARYTYNIGEGKKAYVGAAYEYEFDGDAKATYKGYSTPSPSLKGGSGMLEIGYQVKPTKTSPLTIDIGVNGWTGKQEGVGTNVSLNWKF